jgi:hypothetical protein
MSFALFPIAAEESMEINNILDTNINVLGLKMESGALMKFLTIIVILGLLILCSIGGAELFFLEFIKSIR